MKYKLFAAALTVFCLTAISTYAKEAPTEFLTKRYVQEGVETLRDRLLGKKEKQILHTMWAQSTDVLDDVYEADLLRALRKEAFDPAGLEYSAKNPYRVRIRRGSKYMDLQVQNIFLGKYLWNGQEITLSDYRSAQSLYSRLYEIASKGRSRGKFSAVYDLLIPSAEAAVDAKPLAIASYFVISAISAAINGEDCIGRFQMAENEVRKARKTCQGELAVVRVNPGIYPETKSRALSENLTDMLAGYRFSDMRERSCASIENEYKFRAGWSHFLAKHSCVSGFQNYCDQVDALVSCHTQVRAAAGLGDSSIVQSRTNIKRDPADEAATGAEPGADSAR
jgi:hypothetical protein